MIHKLFHLFLLTFIFMTAIEAQETPNLLRNEQTVQELVKTQPIKQTVFSNLDWKGYFTAVLFIVTFFCLVMEYKPPDITLLLSSGILVIVGILTPVQFLEGFASPILVTIAMLCIVVRALEVNGILEIIGRKILSSSNYTSIQLISYMLPVSFASAFLNNTPIVLLMTPLVRQWALDRSLSPSKYLIPLSYAAIFGGMCTLIGTSTNIVIEGLLSTYSKASSFSFFELAKIGIPLTVAGILYVLLLGQHLIPKRIDPTSLLSQQTREFIVEFLVKENCPLIGKTIKENSKKYFRGEMLIQLIRGSEVIDSPSPELLIFQDDRLIFAGDINKIVQLHAIEDLQSQADPHFKFDLSSSHFSEIVLSTTSWLVGKTPKSANFRKTYGASILAIYRQGVRLTRNVSNTILLPGDTLMLLSGETWYGEDYYNKDFYNIRHAEKLAIFHPIKSTLVVLALAAMIAAMLMNISIMVASLSAVFFLIFTKSISIRLAQNSIVWNILLLIACTFALAKAMVNTGVANLFAQILLSVVGEHPYSIIGGILLITITTTEVLSNNAAALVIFPIAVQSAILAGYDNDLAIKTIGITVAVGCSCGFAIPTGYQTHMIVLGPGGYRFKDFLKIGLPLDFLFWILGTLLIPAIWSFYK